MDAIDKVIAQWANEKPTMNTGPMAIMGRLLRIAKHLECDISALHKQHDLKMGEFDVLSTLRRSGAPHKLTPSELMNSMMLTSGAMTNRLDKLESKGLIIREHSKEDRRSVMISLTENGFVLIDVLIEEHAALQENLFSALDEKQQQQISLLLKQTLSGFE